jgi:hypothetical protein
MSMHNNARWLALDGSARPLSCPGLSRAFTPYGDAAGKDVDGRHKAGHDDFEFDIGEERV